MRVRILAIGTRMPAWVGAGFADYARRLPGDFNLELVELPLGPRGKNMPVERALDAEADAMLRALTPRERVIALDVAGESWPTPRLASEVRAWQQAGTDYSLLIGGPDGLSPRCLQRAERRWSLSPLTLPHPLVRLVLIEQLYRAWSILAGHPYHR